ncbi:MAG: hypothetical protein ABSE73_12355 [Planctomycetota bacterium]
MLKSWVLGLLGCLLCLGLVATGAEEKTKEKKDEKKTVTLPDAVAKAVKDCCQDSVEEAKEKKEGDKVYYEVKVKCSKCNESYKVLVSADGKLLEQGKHKLPSASLPAAVADAVRKWAPGAKLSEMAKVESKRENGSVALYEVKAEIGGETIEAKIGEDGKVMKADKLPEPKMEKKEEKKEKKEDKK